MRQPPFGQVKPKQKIVRQAGKPKISTVDAGYPAKLGGIQHLMLIAAPQKPLETNPVHGTPFRVEGTMACRIANAAPELRQL